jgi:hypothetical protein
VSLTDEFGDHESLFESVADGRSVFREREEAVAVDRGDDVAVANTEHREERPAR